MLATQSTVVPDEESLIVSGTALSVVCCKLCVWGRTFIRPSKDIIWFNVIKLTIKKVLGEGLKDVAGMEGWSLGTPVFEQSTSCQY